MIEAEQRIRETIRETPVDDSSSLRGDGEGRVFLKLENFQLTGSFKIRGAMNKLLSLTAEQRSHSRSVFRARCSVARDRDGFGLHSSCVIYSDVQTAKVVERSQRVLEIPRRLLLGGRRSQCIQWPLRVRRRRGGRCCDV